MSIKIYFEVNEPQKSVCNSLVGGVLHCATRIHVHAGKKQLLAQNLTQH